MQKEHISVSLEDDLLEKIDALSQQEHKDRNEVISELIESALAPDHARKLEDILDRLDAAAVPADMDYPGSHLHSLKGALADLWSVKVSANWRITFRFENGDIYDLDYVDYH
jgi:proteic killer suppression protein